VEVNDVKEAIAAQLANIEEGVKYSAQGKFEQAKLWRSVNLLIGVPAACLAAVAGATALASTTSRIAAGIIALVAAALGAVATTLDASKRAEAAEAAGNRYLALQHEAEIAREVDLPAQDVETSRRVLHEFADRRHEINSQSPSIPRFAYRRAKRNIEREGGQTYRGDARDG
jgi:hypothetical protein